MGARRPRFWRKKEPTALAEAPKDMNTTEKPATKARAEENRPEVGTSPLRSCSMPMPESMEIYPGTSGRTQGERNETSPARKAPARETSFILIQSLVATWMRDETAHLTRPQN